MRLIGGYWKSIVIGIGILYVSLVRDPGISLPSIDGADKWVHGLMYAILGIAIYWDSIRQKISGWLLWLIAMVLPMVYGGIIEIAQERWFAPRSGEWMDWLADCIGVIVGVGLMMIINQLCKNRHA
jgi:VanZ family protein